MDTATHWKNCIVGYGEVAVESVLANERNWRIHTRAQQEALAAVLTEVGIVQNLIINKRTSPAWPADDRYVETLLDGACRVMLALRHGQPTLPVTYVDLDPHGEVTALATLDTITTAAGMDEPLFRALIDDVRAQPTDDTIMHFLVGMLQDTPAEASPSVQEPRSAQEVCCPSCGNIFTPERQGRGQ